MADDHSLLCNPSTLAGRPEAVQLSLYRQLESCLVQVTAAMTARVAQDREDTPLVTVQVGCMIRSSTKIYFPL